MRLATWNVNSLKARLDRVLAWTEAIGPDILCMQETKVADVAMPELAFRALGYEVAHHGLGQWNGVAIASRIGIAGSHFVISHSLSRSSQTSFSS